MTYKKQVVANKVRKVDGKQHVIGAQAANEEEIIIVFVNDLDAIRSKKIEKLSTEGLPTSCAGITNINWLNNFRLKDDNNRNVYLR